jgi:hypothetical protein
MKSARCVCHTTIWIGTVAALAKDLQHKAHTPAAARAVCALWVGMAAFSAPVLAQAQTSATAETGRSVAQEQFICRLPGAPDRRIGIYRPPGHVQRCRVDYMRDGKTRSLWSAGHDYGYCVRKALEIVRLLEQVRFQCSPQTNDAPGSAPIG